MTGGRLISLAETFERALETIQARVSISGPIAVAYSGGLDSSVLLQLAHQHAARRGIDLFAFHIHHGISGNADYWLAHCERECARLDVRFGSRRVQLADVQTHGMEAAARRARYAALGELCRLHGASLLLTAHHRDDQTETVLLQLLRGSGVAGLAGMEIANAAPDLLGYPDLMIARPLLDVSRRELANFVVEHHIPYVEDESNVDPRYARNALRRYVMPALAEYFPGFQQRVVRAAGHMQATQRLLDELAAQDMAHCQDGDCLDLHHVRQLGSERIDNLLRFWLASHAMRMPSAAWLSEMRVQLLAAKEEAQVRVTHADGEIRRYRDRIYLTSRRPAKRSDATTETFRWRGESLLRFDAFGGRLCFEPGRQGIDPGWLRDQNLQIRLHRGGEQLKLSPNRPTRSLKHHYQECGIPAWERERLPAIAVDGQLLFAAGIGMNWRVLQTCEGIGIQLRWKADS